METVTDVTKEEELDSNLKSIWPMPEYIVLRQELLGMK